MTRTAWMIICAAIAASVWGLPGHADPTLSRAEAESLFFKAGQHYDNGAFDEAARDYRLLLDAGYVSAETWYNFGNARFKGGRLGEAVWAYRHAWHLAPRDPDIRANQRFAQQTAGSLTTSPSYIDTVFTEFSWREWRLATSVAAALLFLSLTAWLLLRRRAPWVVHLVAPVAVLLLLTAGGMAYWYARTIHPEAVITDTEQTAYFAPFDDATPAFSLPVGSIVRIHSTTGDWHKVSLGADEGWVRIEHCAKVYPWNK